MKVSARHFLVAAGVCLLAWLFVSQGISYFLYRYRLDQFSVWAGTRAVAADPAANLVFIGTSRIEFGVNPQIFDDEMKKRGRFSRSHNLANPGESPIEIKYSLERLFETVPCCVKYVLAEVGFATFGPMSESPQTLRARTFFNLRNALRYLRFYHSVGFQPTPKLELSEAYRKIFIATALHYTNAGIFKYSPRLAIAKDPALRGFAPLDSSWADHLSTAANATYRASLDSNTNWKVTPEEVSATNVISDYEFDLAMSLASYVRSHGAQFILVRPPETSYYSVDAILLAKVRTWCRNVPLLDFGIPKDYPLLWEPHNRYDYDHVNKDGAVLFSRLLADTRNPGDAGACR